MWNWLHDVLQTRRKRRPVRRHTPRPLALESLEERLALSNVFLQTNLVSDISGLALNTDSSLKNPWGLAASPTGPWWVADNNAGVSTLYNGAGVKQTLAGASSVLIPPPAGSDSTTLAAPTGLVFNGDGGFTVAEDGKTGSAAFIFATEDGTIAGWSFGVDPSHAILEVDNSASGAVYKGLAMGTDRDGRHLLYATNFHDGTIDVFDSKFRPTSVGHDFTDPNLPDGFAPFNIANIDGKLYVTYAKQNDDKHDDVAGAGNGFIDVYNTNGKFLRRLTSGGLLNSPWGITKAPDDFGPYEGDLLVGNFGDGRINVVNPHSGKIIAQLNDPNGNPITIGGLWALRVGNGGQAGDTHALFFTAGINHENDGLFGEIQAIEKPETKKLKEDTAVLQTNLVSDVAGVAAHTDRNLINPWGLSAGPTTDFWASDNGTGVSTLYDAQGNPSSLVVNIPNPPGVTGNSQPTGVIFNSNGGFAVTDPATMQSASSVFLFASGRGTISGWAPSLDLHNAFIAVDHSAAKANYTGLDFATNNGQVLLYAANHAAGGGVEVFGANFQPVDLGAGAFTDPNLPAGFTPYNVVNINGMLYVTYALPGPGKLGQGVVDIYTPDGTLVKEFASGGPLAEPWAVVQAPKGFGAFGGDILVGNVADGHITVYDAKGNLVTQLKDGLGNPIAINGLWGLSFGHGSAANGPTTTLFFNAGIGGYRHGLFGSLQAIEPVELER
jgi:uncharacterized protein (TIGR03118 family)